VWGMIFEIDEREKAILNEVEGLGRGYFEKTTTVVDEAGTKYRVWISVADLHYIDTTLHPYSW